MYMLYIYQIINSYIFIVFVSKMSINNRAQVPGYCGYIPGKNSQNKFGATFAQVTKNSYPTQPESFLTTNIANNQFIQKQHSEV